MPRRRRSTSDLREIMKQKEWERRRVPIAMHEIPNFKLPTTYLDCELDRLVDPEEREFSAETYVFPFAYRLSYRKRRI